MLELAVAKPPLGGLIDWYRERRWIPIVAVLALWTVMPLVRRLFDWAGGGFSTVDAFSIVPLLALVPAAFALSYGGKIGTLDRKLGLFAWTWTCGFTSAYLVAIQLGVPVLAATYTFAQFILPMLFGLWVATVDLPVELLYDRTADALLWMSTPVCLYAAWQFVAPPPWDVFWMAHAGIGSIGHPYPYQLRPFATLNGPAVFADFLDITIALNLPRMLSARTPLRSLQLSLCIAVLALTMVRTGWVGFAVALATYLALTPNRARNLAVFGLVAAVCAVVVMNASVLLGSGKAGNEIATRLSTLQNLNADYSFVDRQKYFGKLLADAAAQPLGEGLGNIGTAAKLSSRAKTLDFDNGFVARFTEMGYFGTACYLLSVGGLLWFALDTWRRYTIRGLPLSAIAAAVVAVQVMLLALDMSYDHHEALSGIAFWLTLAFVPGLSRLAKPDR